MTTFTQALAQVINRDEKTIHEARTVITREVCDALGISWSSDEAERLGDWLATGEYSGTETPEQIAAEWRREA